MTHLRLLLSALLLSALSACAADLDDPELDTAEVDRGSVALYAPGPSGGGQQSLQDDKGVLILNNWYDTTARHGHSQFRIYTRNSGVWTDAHVQTLCTDGNWVEGRKADFVDPGYWMFVDVDCPSPYSVSEAWVAVHLDY
jgi:hypothetical protein